MSQKVLLILIDGLRPDAVRACPDPRLKALYERGLHDLAARTTYPPVTLPCHISLFHSVDADRHGVLTNTFVPQNHPVRGLVETLHAAGKTCAFFYTWAQLRDLCPADESLSFAWFMNQGEGSYAALEKRETRAAIDYIREFAPDFAFLYLGGTDEIGHKYGWMSKEYMDEVASAADCCAEIVSTLPDDYAVILTADHGGHGRHHGDDVPEDMTIPVAFIGDEFPPQARSGVTIKDIAPTVAEILGVKPDRNWEGNSVL